MQKAMQVNKINFNIKSSNKIFIIKKTSSWTDYTVVTFTLVDGQPVLASSKYDFTISLTLCSEFKYQAQ